MLESRTNLIRANGCYTAEALACLLERKLNVETQLEIHEHLESCRECRDLVYLLRRLKDAPLYREALEAPNWLHDQSKASDEENDLEIM